jgi:hypothetical protein
MATMPSRATTAPLAIESILPQVSRLWLFLDRFETVPDFAEHERIEVLRSQDLGDLRANGKFVALALDARPCTFLGLDDDVLYPADYCNTLESHLGRWPGAAVGVHGGLLPPEVTSYAGDLKVLHRRAPRERATEVDLLGTDSVAFRTSTLRFDVRDWPDVNVVDLSFALTARRRSVPLVTIARKAYWMNASPSTRINRTASGRACLSTIRGRRSSPGSSSRCHGHSCADGRAGRGCSLAPASRRRNAGTRRSASRPRPRSRCRR